MFVRRLVGAEAVDTLGNIGRRSQNAERFAELGSGRKCLTAGALDYSRFPSPTYGFHAAIIGETVMHRLAVSARAAVKSPCVANLSISNFRLALSTT